MSESNGSRVSSIARSITTNIMFQSSHIKYREQLLFDRWPWKLEHLIQIVANSYLNVHSIHTETKLKNDNTENDCCQSMPSVVVKKKMFTHRREYCKTLQSQQ